MFLKSHFKEYENLILTYCKFSCITLAFYMMLWMEVNFVFSIMTTHSQEYNAGFELPALTLQQKGGHSFLWRLTPFFSGLRSRVALVFDRLNQI